MSSVGYKVQGSDISYSKNIERCRKIGIKIFSNHNKNNIANIILLMFIKK